MSDESKLKCASCKGPVRPRVDNPDFPFCSSRCKAVDLARWFTGSYVVPGPSLPPDQLPLRDDNEPEPTPPPPRRKRS